MKIYNVLQTIPLQ